LALTACFQHLLKKIKRKHEGVDAMRKALAASGLALLLGWASQAAEVQGVVADWSCVQDMVKNGRESTLKRRRDCSLMKDFNRDAYGLISDEKKYYKLDDPGNQRILELLRNTPDKDNLKVVVTGDVQGQTIKVTNITML
jgi:hypothetical protein